MVVFPNCKINLGLHILRKRRDGFHDLETVFYPIPFFDSLEIIPATTNTSSFAITGLSIPGDPASNLCVKAYQLLKKDFADLPPIQMHLHKAIPNGAGLGGGSSNAAFALKLLNNLFALNLSTLDLNKYAIQLGSDCPFFIINKPCLASGRGEILETIPLSLANYQLCIINPGIHIETGLAFLQVVPAIPPTSLDSIIHQPAESWKALLQNDFETVTFKKYPELQKIKEQLYASGAIYAAMTGSGATLFGLFRKGAISLPAFPSNYFIRLMTDLN